MSSACTWCLRIVERTLRIGFGIKGASEVEIGLPKPLAFQPPLGGREAIPLRPLVADQFFGLNHGKNLAVSGGRANPLHRRTAVIDRRYNAYAFA